MLDLTQVRFLASVPQRWCCVLPLGAACYLVASPFGALTAIVDHHVDPLIYCQGDANTQPGLKPLVCTCRWGDCVLGLHHLCKVLEERQETVMIVGLGFRFKLLMSLFFPSSFRLFSPFLIWLVTCNYLGRSTWHYYFGGLGLWHPLLLLWIR